MTAKNFEKLSAKAQYRVLICMFMEIHNSKPCDIYNHTKHHYNFIKRTTKEDVNHRLDCADDLFEKFGYKLVIHAEPIAGKKGVIITKKF